MPGATTAGTGSRGRPSGGVGATVLGPGEGVDEVRGAVEVVGSGEVDGRSTGRRTAQPARTAATSATTATPPTSRAAGRERALPRWGRRADAAPGNAVRRRPHAPRTPAATRTRWPGCNG